MVLATLNIEKLLWEKGYKTICGVDEVGRGCFAGPVVSAAVIFPPNVELPQGVADSKLLKPRIREFLAGEIKKVALCYFISEVSVEVINKVGIGKATQISFYNGVKGLSVMADFVLIDAFFINQIDKRMQLPIKGGDRISASIAAASILAKVYRDKLMEDLAKKYPNFYFEKNKGYGTKDHREAIFKNGLTKMHRTSFNLTKYLS